MIVVTFWAKCDLCGVEEPAGQVAYFNGLFSPDQEYLESKHWIWIDSNTQICPHCSYVHSNSFEKLEEALDWYHQAPVANCFENNQDKKGDE